jgi:dipeptidyl-peptidase-4
MPKHSVSLYFVMNATSMLIAFLIAGLVQYLSAEIALAQQLPSAPPLTIAESSDFTATATATEVQTFLAELGSDWPDARLVTLGETVEGRPILALCIGQSFDSLSGLPHSSRKEINRLGSPFTFSTESGLKVMVMGGIHPGECDGKEAILAYLRNLKISGLAELSTLQLVFVPLLNADGESRRGLNHRPGQAGPSKGMGIRENAQGLDLNRDFVKLDSPEVRSLVAAINDWDIDVLIDLHTTNGSLHRYDLTYDIAHNPAAPQQIDQFLRSQLLPRITQRLKEKNIPTFFYGNFDRDHQRWETYGHQPRYSTEYMGLRGKIGILSESYSYASYQKRFEASYHFVDEVLKELATNAASIQNMLRHHQQQATAGRPIPISASSSLTDSEVVVQGFSTASGLPPSPPFQSLSSQDLEPKDYTVELWNSASAVETIALPAAYALDAQHAWAVGRLMMHGVPVSRLLSEETMTAQVASLTEVKAGRSYQGHRLKTLLAQWRTETATLAPGTFIVSTSGPVARLVAYLLEPQSDENLAMWNFLDPGLTAGADYPVMRLNQLPSELTELTETPQTEQLTLEKIMASGDSINLSGSNVVQSVSWLPGMDPVEAVYQREDLWYAIDVVTGSTRRVTELAELEKKLAALEGFSADEARAAAGRSRIWTGEQPWALIRHRDESYLYQRDNGSIRRVGKGSDRSMQLPELSPTGEHIAFIRDNNLWILDCQTGAETQLTDDGSTDILNGILDWVYQEELYGRGNFKGFWWSPDGKQIAWLQLDQTQVPEYLVADSVSVSQKLEKTRYPKAGQPIPSARVWISNVSDGSRREADLQIYPLEDRLIGRVSWSPDNLVWLQVLNRVQNRQDLVRVEPLTGISTCVITEVTNGWIELRDTPHFLADGREFLWLSDLPEGRTHLYRVDSATGRSVLLTKGDWDVKELVSVSQDERTAFVTGNIASPVESHLVAVDLSTAEVRQITDQPGTHSVSVHPSGRFYIDNFSDLTTLPTTSIHSIDGQLRFILSAPINDRHQSLKIQAPSIITIPARDGFPMPTMLLLPWGVQHDTGQTVSADSTGPLNDTGASDQQERLPVLFHVYAGPQAPIVRNQTQQRNYWWHQMLCSQGYAVVLVDNRSSQGRGIADTWTIRGDMGRVELQDLEDAVQWVAKQPWADPSRFGLWGWSYGGYMTAYAMTNSQSFKAGISGAPVTDWKNYDAIYTERYMDLPAANKSGYDSSSAVQAAPKLSGRLLLIHGERDDNVHLSNTLQMVNALQQAGKQFDLMIYPKARHGVVDPKQRIHMHQMMTDFLERHLKN